jgi:hypothetical protein
MVRHQEIEKGWSTLQSIFTLLLSLADLADRAEALPWDERLHILQIMQVAEVAARDLVIGLTIDPGSPMTLCHDALRIADVENDGGAEAAQIAACLRVLAFALACLMSCNRPPAGRCALRTDSLRRFGKHQFAEPEIARRGAIKSRAWSG